MWDCIERNEDIKCKHKFHMGNTRVGESHLFVQACLMKSVDDEMFISPFILLSSEKAYSMKLGNHMKEHKEF